MNPGPQAGQAIGRRAVRGCGFDKDPFQHFDRGVQAETILYQYLGYRLEHCGKDFPDLVFVASRH
jgi:hypothetical protein